MDDDVQNEEEILDEQEQAEKVQAECDVHVREIALEEVREENLFVVRIELDVDEIEGVAMNGVLEVPMEIEQLTIVAETEKDLECRRTSQMGEIVVEMRVGTTRCIAERPLRSIVGQMRRVEIITRTRR